jgi:NADPH-dependent 2,4-dienoyl-CoA reductase/sulfur reductase-like enzyme
MKPDVLIAAIGAESIRPPIPGIGGRNVVMAETVDKVGAVDMSAKADTANIADITAKARAADMSAKVAKFGSGGDVVIIGGGLVGIETAIHLARRGKKVTVVEMAEKYAPDANFRHIQSIDRELAIYGVTVKTETKCTAITGDGVIALGKDNTELFFPADTVVICVGMRPLEDEFNVLKNAVCDFVAIGNCVSVGQVEKAIRSGYDAAINIGT